MAAAGFQQKMLVISLNGKKAKEIYFAILAHYLHNNSDKKTDIKEANLITLNDVISFAKRKASSSLLNKKPLKKQWKFQFQKIYKKSYVRIFFVDVFKALNLKNFLQYLRSIHSKHNSFKWEICYFQNFLRYCHTVVVPKYIVYYNQNINEL